MFFIEKVSNFQMQAVQHCLANMFDSIVMQKCYIQMFFLRPLPPFSLLRDFSFQNTSEHFAKRFRQSCLIWEVCDVTAIELSSKE